MFFILVMKKRRERKKEGAIVLGPQGPAGLQGRTDDELLLTISSSSIPSKFKKWKKKSLIIVKET
jgi:hypothetical protein